MGLALLQPLAVPLVLEEVEAEGQGEGVRDVLLQPLALSDGNGEVEAEAQAVRDAAAVAEGHWLDEGLPVGLCEGLPLPVPVTVVDALTLPEPEAQAEMVAEGQEEMLPLELLLCVAEEQDVEDSEPLAEGEGVGLPLWLPDTEPLLLSDTVAEAVVVAV